MWRFKVLTEMIHTQKIINVLPRKNCIMRKKYDYLLILKKKNMYII